MGWRGGGQHGSRHLQGQRLPRALGWASIYDADGTAPFSSTAPTDGQGPECQCANQADDRIEEGLLGRGWGRRVVRHTPKLASQSHTLGG